MLILETIVLAATLATPLPQGCGGGHSQGGHGGHSRPAESSQPRVKATNTLCPVMSQPVKPGKDREVVIRGNYYLVCCDGCGPLMAENPDKYLDKEGRPKNAPKDPDGSKTREPQAPAQADHSEHQP